MHGHHRSLSQQPGPYKSHTFSSPLTSMVASSLSRNAAVALPSPAVQNQIHELAKTLPPPRKQNIACDACRYAHFLYPIPLFTAHRLVAHAHTTRQAKKSQMPPAPWSAKGTDFPSCPSFPFDVTDGSFPLCLQCQVGCHASHPTLSCSHTL